MLEPSNACAIGNLVFCFSCLVSVFRLGFLAMSLLQVPKLQVQWRDLMIERTKTPAFHGIFTETGAQQSQLYIEVVQVDTHR